MRTRHDNNIQSSKFISTQKYPYGFKKRTDKLIKLVKHNDIRYDGKLIATPLHFSESHIKVLISQSCKQQLTGELFILK